MPCKIDICGNINTLLTLAAAGFGWWVVHRLNSARDRINSERTARITELSRVHSALVRAGIDGALSYKDLDGNVVFTHREVEDAIGKIYLYGTAEQIALAQAYVLSWSEGQGADGTKLVDSLRNHIRDSLGLSAATGPLQYLRVRHTRNENRE